MAPDCSLHRQTNTSFKSVIFQKYKSRVNKVGYNGLSSAAQHFLITHVRFRIKHSKKFKILKMLIFSNRLDVFKLKICPIQKVKKINRKIFQIKHSTAIFFKIFKFFDVQIAKIYYFVKRFRFENCNNWKICWFVQNLQINLQIFAPIRNMYLNQKFVPIRKIIEEQKIETHTCLFLITPTLL